MLGWGMNDHNLANVGGIEPDVFKENLIKLVAMIRERMGAEVVIFSVFPPNDKWHHATHRMEVYAQATRQVAEETQCAYVDIFGLWETVLKRKNISSLLANNINHPNDFGHWLYEQAFEAMKIEESE